GKLVLDDSLALPAGGSLVIGAGAVLAFGTAPLVIPASSGVPANVSATPDATSAEETVQTPPATAAAVAAVAAVANAGLQGATPSPSVARTLLPSPPETKPAARAVVDAALPLVQWSPIFDLHSTSSPAKLLLVSLPAIAEPFPALGRSNALVGSATANSASAPGFLGAAAWIVDAGPNSVSTTWSTSKERSMELIDLYFAD